MVRHGEQWLEAHGQRMDAMIVIQDGQAFCRRLRDIKKGDAVVVGNRGIRVIPEAKERDRLAFAFMSNEISSERQVETAVVANGGPDAPRTKGRQAHYCRGRAGRCAYRRRCGAITASFAAAGFLRSWPAMRWPSTILKRRSLAPR